MGESAAAAATGKPVVEGAVGAGTGATVGKIFGMERAMKSGVGTYTVPLEDGVIVSALAAVNAVGDIIDTATGKIVAGARVSKESGEFANSAEQLKRGAGSRTLRELRNKNTTLV